VQEMTRAQINAEYDLAKIGAVSAEFSAAITAVDECAIVALIGYGEIAKTCGNVGCQPSKALIRAVETLHVSDASSRFDGIASQASATGWKGVIARKQALMDELRISKYADLLPSYNPVSYIHCKARFRNDGALAVDGKPLNARKIVIATSTQPAMPTIEGIEAAPFLTRTTALEDLPDTIMVIGPGYIGAEIAKVFAKAGGRLYQSAIRLCRVDRETGNRRRA
jgi:mercuric reductase